MGHTSILIGMDCTAHFREVFPPFNIRTYFYPISSLFLAIWATACRSHAHLWSCPFSRKIWQRLTNCQVQTESVSKSELEEACRDTFSIFFPKISFEKCLPQTWMKQFLGNLIVWSWNVLNRFFNPTRFSWIFFLRSPYFWCDILLDQVQRQMARHSGGKSHKCSISLR